jgi:hypothetical protein
MPSTSTPAATRTATRPPPAHATRDGDPARVAAFLDEVYALPADTWLARGAVECARDDRDALARARQTLHTVLETQALGLAAWRARDAAQTVAELRGCTGGDGAKHWPVTLGGVAERHGRAACAALERATLAVLARAGLPPNDFATLVAPFVEEAR